MEVDNGKFFAGCALLNFKSRHPTKRGVTIMLQDEQAPCGTVFEQGVKVAIRLAPAYQNMPVGEFPVGAYFGLHLLGQVDARIAPYLRNIVNRGCVVKGTLYVLGEFGWYVTCKIYRGGVDILQGVSSKSWVYPTNAGEQRYSSGMRPFAFIFPPVPKNSHALVKKHLTQYLELPGARVWDAWIEEEEKANEPVAKKRCHSPPSPRPLDQVTQRLIDNLELERHHAEE